MSVETLTGDEVAQILRISRDTVYRLAGRGKIPGRKVGRIWQIPRAAIEAYIEMPFPPVNGACSQPGNTVVSVIVGLLLVLATGGSAVA